MLYSLIVDGIFRLTFYMNRELKTPVSVQDVAALLLFCSRDCDGQLLVHQILNTFAAKRFRGEEMGFTAAFQKCPCLYILCCQETLYLWPGSKKKWGVGEWLVN